MSIIIVSSLTHGAPADCSSLTGHRGGSNEKEFVILTYSTTILLPPSPIWITDEDDEDADGDDDDDGFLCVITTDLVPVDGVIMFDRVDLGHREGDGKAHDGDGEGLHYGLSHHVDVGGDRSLVPATVAASVQRWDGVPNDQTQSQGCVTHPLAITPTTSMSNLIAKSKP